MLRVIGANPAMDRTSTWPPLRLGQVNRAEVVSVVPGGKGLNVARASVRLGSDASAYGFLGGPVGTEVRAMIAGDGVIDRHTDIASGTRVCFIVVEPGTERTTVLNEPGPVVVASEVERLLDTVRADLHESDVVVLAGSLPDSVSASVVGEIIDLGRATGARTLVDIHSEALRVAFAHKPWMLKCNQRELLGLLGAPDPDASLSSLELASEMDRIRSHGIEVVVVTLGADGALLADREGAVQVRVPQIKEVNPTGSGDLLMAGLAVGIDQGLEAREAIVLGAACGTAGATHLLPELPPDFDSAAWLQQISLEVISERP